LGFARTVGVDVNPEVIEEAEAVLDEVHLGNSSVLRRVDGSIGLVAANGVVLHILEAEEVQRLSQDVYESLTPGGFFVVAVLDSRHYLSPDGFVPWTGPLSCTRTLEESLRLLTQAGFRHVESVGTFINPWFCTHTLNLANQANLKTDRELFAGMTLIARSLRRAGLQELFAEYLMVLRKPI